MNCSCYIFGNFDGSYTQYPDDQMSTLFKTCVHLSSKEKQLVIHRDEKLIHYVYIQSLKDEANSYVGLCLTTNGLIISDFQGIYNLLKTEVEKMAVSGEILDFLSEDIVSKTDLFYKKNVEIQTVFNELKDNIDRLKKTVIELPPIKYGINCESYKINLMTDTREKLLDSFSSYGYLVLIEEESKDAVLSEVEKIIKSTPLLPKKKKYKLKTKDKVIIVLAIALILETLILIKLL